MRVLVSIFMLAILSATFFSMHGYTRHNVSLDHSVVKTDIGQSATAQKNDVNQHEPKDFLHKYCSVSCFVIPASYKFSHFSMKGNVTAYKVGYLEFLFVNRLKRPPRHSA